MVSNSPSSCEICMPASSGKLARVSAARSRRTSSAGVQWASRYSLISGETMSDTSLPRLTGHDEIDPPGQDEAQNHGQHPRRDPVAALTVTPDLRADPLPAALQTAPGDLLRGALRLIGLLHGPTSLGHAPTGTGAAPVGPAPARVTCWRSTAPPARRTPGTGPCRARCAAPGR